MFSFWCPPSRLRLTKSIWGVGLSFFSALAFAQPLNQAPTPVYFGTQGQFGGSQAFGSGTQFGSQAAFGSAAPTQMPEMPSQSTLGTTGQPSFGTATPVPSAPDFGSTRTFQFGSTQAPSAAQVFNAPVHYIDADPLQDQLSAAASALNASLAGLDGLQARVLPVNQAPYLGFARSLVPLGSDGTAAGFWSLEAMFLAGATANGQPTPLCFLLYNAPRQKDLEDNFFAPARAAHQERQAIEFVVAHEIGHCVDYQQHGERAPGTLDSNGQLRWQESGADLFAGLTVLQTGGPAEVIERIAHLRERADDTHATAPVLNGLLQEWNAGHLPVRSTALARWALAQHLRSQYFQ